MTLSNASFLAPFITLLMLNMSVISSTEPTLVKHQVKNYVQKGALCNDGTPAIYYFHQGNNKSQNWLLYVEGGGGCFNTSGDCLKRYNDQKYFMSSTPYPDTIVPKTIMAERAFYDYNKVLLVYCSSDLWLGNSTIDNNSLHQKSKRNSSQNSYYFRGKVIFESVVEDLISARGLANARQVYVVGQSAGGVGVANHLKYIRYRLPSDFTNIYAILDSAWFINYDNYFTRSNQIDSLQESGITKHEACQDISWGYPCCFSLACLIGKSYLPKDVETLLLISKYDIYVLFNGLLEKNKPAKQKNILRDKDVLVKVHSYGGRMQQTVQMTQNVDFVFTSCFQHSYLVSSDLWNSLYESDITITFSSVQFKHTVNDSHWRNVDINGSSIRKIVMDWSRTVQSRNQSYALERPQRLQFYDKCLHAQCNPSCPRMIFFDDFRSPWQFWQKIVLVCIVLFITICCLVTKCHWIVQHQNLKKSQALYLNANYEGGNLFEKVMCLPTCPPHSAIGISCTDLSYDVTTAFEGNSLKPGKHGEKPGGSSKILIRKRSSQLYGKKIIKGITAYFNPGQLVAIMGPSGSGKTTLLDVLTARKHLKDAESNISINGLPAEETREWFIKNSGYVLQLATPYHEELTVRQNLTYSAMMRLPMKMKVQDKMWRVEQVLGQCGLYNVADVVVGDNSPIGGGLSGGQKRRLCIALQLLDLPSVIFLDEPTSGLDSASSLELLETLHGLTLSGRLVVVTIHQPRIEIFHMFDTILFLCDGQVAYFGSPIMAPNMIAEALEGSDQVFDATNPADSIMDVLTNPKSQKIILDYYLQSGEIQSINRAIARAKRHPQKTLSMKFQKQTSSIQNRLLALDGRSSAAQTFSQMFYFPIIFLLYGLALGTCYFQTNKGVLLMSCYMVFSCASQLFMASVIHAHLNKAFALFALEKADGVSHSTELVLHVFIRTFSKSSIPLFFSCVIIYMCTVRDYVLWKFCLTTLIHLQLNQTWIAIIIFTACGIPRYSSLVTPLLSAIAGFAGGFLVPEPQMPDIYYWMFYVNPTHWAYSGMMKALINDVTFECPWENSPLECQESTGIVILEQFGFSERNPYVSMLVLLIMLATFLVLSVIMLEIKYSKRKWDKVKKSYWQAFTQFITRCHHSLRENHHRKQREHENEERERLFKLVEQQYRYKTETYDSAHATQPYVPTNDDGTPALSAERIRLEVTEDGEVRERAQTLFLSEESSNSSNDEDIDPTAKVSRKSLLGIRKSAIQQNSLSSIFTKLQKTSVVSRSGVSIGSNAGMEEVPMRKKNNKTKRWKIAQRRKTFTGFIKEENENDTPPVKQRRRPKSVLLPSRKHTTSESASLLKLPRAHSLIESNHPTPNLTPITSRQNTFSSSVNTVIEHNPNDDKTSVSIVRRPAPPDIVIDIERSSTALLDSTRNPDTQCAIQNHDFGDRKLKTHSGSFEQSTGGSIPPSVNGTLLRKKKKKKDLKSRDTWSKYLDPSPKRHEVYCALNSVKKRLRGNGRGVRGVLKKSDSVHLQRKASSLILTEKKDSMRSQLSGLRRAYLVNDYENSPSLLKRMQLIRTRDKFQRINALDNNPSFVNDSRHANNSNDYGKYDNIISGDNIPGVCIPVMPGGQMQEENVVVPRLPNRCAADKALLERLSALSGHMSSTRSSIANTVSSSKRSSRSSRINSQFNSVDNSAADSVSDVETSTEIFNVLRKLHNSIDKLEDTEFHGNEKQETETKVEQNTTENDIVMNGNRAKRRDSDPLLPEERSLVESLLYKYQHLEIPNSPALSEPAKEKKETVLFSSTVKIRGASPGHSRKVSDTVRPTMNKASHDQLENLVEESNNNVDALQRRSNNNLKVDAVDHKGNVNILDNTKRSANNKDNSITSQERTQHIENKNTEKPTQQQQSRSRRPSRHSRSRKVSTVKQVAGLFEALQREENRKDANVSIIPEQKYYDSSASDSSASLSSSSEYEDDIMKTHEGFIIPDDAINKLHINNKHNHRDAQHLHEEEEEIERQFKKENFLKDRPARRGMRTPNTSSTGKVNLLKSKFEGKSLANALVAERLHHSSRRNSTNSKNIEILQNQQGSIGNSGNSSGASGKHKGNFFKRRRHPSSKSNDTNSESEVDGNHVIVSPVAYRHITNYHDIDDDDDVFIGQGFGDVLNEHSSDIYFHSSSERCPRQYYYHCKNRDQTAPQNFDEGSSYEDEFCYSEDEKSVCSYTSDRKRKTFTNKNHNLARTRKRSKVHHLLSKDFYYDSIETIC